MKSKEKKEEKERGGQGGEGREWYTNTYQELVCYPPSTQELWHTDRVEEIYMKL